VRYLHGRPTRSCALFALDGKAAGDVGLPTLGSIVQVTAANLVTRRCSTRSRRSCIRPRYSGTTSRPAHPPSSRRRKLRFDPSKYETVQVFYHSKDGTSVPLFLTYKKGVKQDGSNANVPVRVWRLQCQHDAGLSIGVLAWLEMGGVYAQAVLRGGSEYGEEWHQAGMLDRKQNVFDDFIGAAEYLIAERYTSPAQVGDRRGLEWRVADRRRAQSATRIVRRRLAGGRCDGHAALSQVHDRLGVGHRIRLGRQRGAVPVSLSVLAGPQPEAGDALSATLITTADHDDRVVPGHSFKYAATLQTAQGGPEPVLIRIETKAARRRQADRQGDRGADRSLGVPRSHSHMQLPAQSPARRGLRRRTVCPNPS